MNKKIFILLFAAAFGIAAALQAAGSKPFLLGHITTCSGLINNYPADSTNWFYKKQHKVVQYFAYMLFPGAAGAVSLRDRAHLFVNPYEYYSKSDYQEAAGNYVFENKWISPSGKVICEKVLSWDKDSKEDKIKLEGRQYTPYAFANYIGISERYAENGQDNLPDETGLYHIDLYVNGELAAVTFFEIKD